MSEQKLRILITGDRGFVGVATRKELEAHGHYVIGYDLMDNKDITDIGQLEYVVENERPHRILHLAAIARFADSDRDPKLAFETNVQGTRNVAAVAKKFHVPVVYSSTGSTYMPIQQEDKILTEESRAVGNSVYGCTKYVGETYIKQVNPHIILRYAHLYGPEKRYHGLIGGFLSRIEFGMKPVLFGGKQSNDFTHIDDIARANRLALETSWDNWNQVYNIGTGEELTAEVAGDIICDVFGYTGGVEKKEMRTVDPMRFWFSVDKAEKMLGFKAAIDFRTGLEMMKKEMSTAKDVKKTV